MSDESNQRSHPRLHEHHTIFVEMLSSAPGSGHNAIAICDSLEISARGMRVRLDDTVEPGAILQLGVELSEVEAPLYLAAQVRWCTPNSAEGIGYCVGFELLDSDGTDFADWYEIIIA